MASAPIYSNYDISALNTFHIQAKAKKYYAFSSLDELKEVKKDELIQPFLILGGGSNLLFTSDFGGTIFHPCNKGIEVIGTQTDKVYVKVQAGEVWDDFVAWACGHNLWGVENLSLIPGNVGASPVQNIGAYGSEAKDAIHEVECYDLQTAESFMLSKEDCEFSYRNSVFKHDYKHAVVVSVTFCLNTQANPQLSYSNLQQAVESKGEISLSTIRNTIIEIRESKLPDPEKIGNAGSFFKNPVVSAVQAKQLIESFPAAVHYPLENGNVKFAAGWLIDSAGLKGYRSGPAGVHENQALVLVNYGGAKGEDIVGLSEFIQKTVFERYGIELEPEVLFI